MKHTLQRCKGILGMEKVVIFIDDARKRVAALVIIARWIWVVNSLVAITSVGYHRYDIAALAAFTWVLSLLAAAFGHRAAKHLITAERTLQSSP